MWHELTMTIIANLVKKNFFLSLGEGRGEAELLFLLPSYALVQTTFFDYRRTVGQKHVENFTLRDYFHPEC